MDDMEDDDGDDDDGETFFSDNLREAPVWADVLCPVWAHIFFR